MAADVPVAPSADGAPHDGLDGPGVGRAARAEAAAGRLPSWLGSIRVRLAVIYSTVLFGLAAIVVGVIYVGALRTLDDQPISRDVQALIPVGDRVVLVEGQQIDPYLYIERRANERALQTLRTYSFGSLIVLFGTSLVLGWVVAGQVLKPIDRITAVARDITATDLSRRIDLDGPQDELRDLADTFDDMLARLDAAFENQRQFIHEASHELRNPLAVIRTNVDVVLADPDASAADLRDAVEVVQRASERMSRLVDDLLVYARRGQLSLERAPLDVADLAVEAGADFRAPAEEAGVELAVGAEPGLSVVGDRQALRQAIDNLVANALRYAPRGSAVRLSAGRAGPWVFIGVADEGAGLSPEQQAHVFDRFWRGDPAEGRAHGRSGLGLTIVRQIAEAHGGEVRLVSAPGRGTTFALWVPAWVPAADQAGGTPGDDAPTPPAPTPPTAP